MSGRILDVTGGPAGVAAMWADVLRLAGDLDAEGDRLGGHTAATTAVMDEPALLETGLLSPSTAAAAEVALLAAVAALVAAHAEWEASAAAVRAAVAVLEQADAFSRGLVRALDIQLMASPAGLFWLQGALATGHPGLLEHAVAGLSGVAGPALLATLYGGSRRPRVAPYAQPTGGWSRRRPQSVTDLVVHLAEVAALSPGPHSAGNGTIEVQTIRRADGTVRHVVYLPGTDRFDPPWDDGADVRGMATNLDLMSGRPDPYTAGVTDALHQAGVRPDDPVLVVGHSQGGMAAAALVAGGSGFAVTAAVTAGSPTAQVPAYPSGTHVLSLEQRGDVVPLLDGAPNADSAEQTTVTFDVDPPNGVLAHHGYDTYAHGAALVDASSDPSVVATVEALQDGGFLGDDDVEVTAQLFQITPGP